MAPFPQTTQGVSFALWVNFFLLAVPSFHDGSMKCLQICMFDSDFYLQQISILHLDVKVKNVQLRVKDV